MKKKLYWFFYSTGKYIKSNLKLFFIIITTLSLSLSSVIYFYSSSKSHDREQMNAGLNVQIELQRNPSKTSVINLLQDSNLHIKNISFFGKISNGINGLKDDETVNFISNIEPIYNAVVIGEKISQKNIDNCDKVIIINKSLEKKLNKNIGDKVIISDANFEIIGIENDSSIKGDYIYFPYTTILSLKIKSTDLIIQMKNDFFENDFSILDSAIKKQGIAYKQIKYPEISSELMERFAFKMITSFVVVLLAIVNFIYLFKYYLNKRQKDYSIYSITGLSKASIAIMFTVEGIIMFILSFLLAIGLFYLLYIVFITNIFKLTPLIYGFSEILEVFIFSFIFTLILIIIILFFLLKKSSISNYKEMEGM